MHSLAHVAIQLNTVVAAFLVLLQKSRVKIHPNYAGLNLLIIFPILYDEIGDLKIRQ